MPLQNNLNLNAFLGAAVLGVIGVVGMYLVERNRRLEKNSGAMAKDVAQLHQDLSQLKRDFEQLLSQKKDRVNKVKRPRSVHRANSVASTATDDYSSPSNLDSSDQEIFYDVSDGDSDGNLTPDPSPSIFNLDNVLKEIDKQMDAGNVSELENTLERLTDLHLEDSKNPDILWRIGKVHHRIADKSEDKKFIQEHISKGVDACASALELNPSSAEVHKWYAILIGARSEIVPIQQKIKDAHLLKKHVDLAISLDPTDPTLYHMLGRFSYEVAGLKWYERKAAAAIFSELPTATYVDALSHFLEAEKLANFEWKENKMMIAKCKIEMNDYNDATYWLDKAANCKQGDGLDDKIDSEIKALLEKYNSYR